MFTRRYIWSIAIMSTVLLFLVGCATSGQPPDPQSETSTTSPLKKPSPTSILLTLTPESSLILSELPMGPGAEWDLVVIGDSSMWKLADAFAAQIENDVGVKVLPHDVTIGGLEAGKVLRALQTGDVLYGLPDTLREAEVVVMFVNPLLSIGPENPLDLEGCFAYQSKAPESCSMDTLKVYIADLKEIWAEIIKLRAGQPTILRATDIYNPLVNRWQLYDVFEACTECWVNLSEANRIAAEAYNIPFFSRLEVFNGPDYTDNPTEKGYIRNDGEHPTDLMGQHTAEMLAQLGYEPVSPP